MGNRVGKFCVFCGSENVGKNREHVIPMWLIKLTGNPKRTMYTTPSSDSDPNLMKKIPFDSFKFHSCQDCNNSYSVFEKKTKTIITDFLDNKPLSSNDFHDLLNWFDKVRIGLWGGSIYMLKTPIEIEPRFLIKKKIKQDRTLLIYKIHWDKKALNIIGAGSAVFQGQPSCFGLWINNYLFINVSNEFLISRKFGLPYPKEWYFRNSGIMNYVMNPGNNRMSYPPTKFRYETYCTQIFQPILHKEIKEMNNGIYDSTHVKSIIKNYNDGIGYVFFYNGNEIEKYPDEKSHQWFVDYKLNDDDLRKVLRQIPEIQNYLLKRSMKFLPEEKHLFKTHIKVCERAMKSNRAFINKIINDYKDMKKRGIG
jgi:hypothetical protein